MIPRGRLHLGDLIYNSEQRMLLVTTRNLNSSGTFEALGNTSFATQLIVTVAHPRWRDQVIMR